MKVKAYVRVGKPEYGRVKVSASNKPNEAPLTDSQGPVPTVAFAVEVELPDVMFKRAQQIIADLKVPESQATIAAKVTKR